MIKTKATVLVSAAALALACASHGASAQSAAPEVSAADAKAAAKAEREAAKAKARAERELRARYGMGPYPAETAAFLETKPEALRPFFRTLYTGGERNAVLNFNRLGLAAMQEGEWKIAEVAFEGALQRIEAVYAQSKAAEQAKSVWKSEARKDYKGEPHERAMAFYYRGLLYLRANDFDNARASFKQALFQDSINQEGTRGQDFASMNYLAGWASHCAGDKTDAEEQFGYATKAKASLVRPAPTANVLYIAELGYGPVKAKGGANSELLEYQSASGSPENAAKFTVDKVGAIETVPAASITYQATEREGRKMDGVLRGKAQTKQATAAMGNAMMQTSMFSNSSGGALGGMFGGLLMKGLASSMHADADIRNWDTLPEHIMIASGKAPAGKPVPAKVRFFDGAAPVPVDPAALQVASGPKCSLVWARSRSAVAAPAETPGDAANVAAANSRRADVQLKDKQFRNSLVDF